MQSQVDVNHHMEHGELDDMLDALDTVYDIHPARKALMLSTSGGKRSGAKHKGAAGSGGTSDTDFISSVASMEHTQDESSPDMIRLAAGMGKALAHSAGSSDAPTSTTDSTAAPVSMIPRNTSTSSLSGAGLRHRPVLLERFAEPSRALRGLPRDARENSESSSSDLENLEAIVYASPIKTAQAKKGKAPLQARTPTSTATTGAMLGIPQDPVHRAMGSGMERTNSTPLHVSRTPTSPSTDGTLSHMPGLGRLGDSTPNIMASKRYVPRRASVAGGTSSAAAAAAAANAGNPSYLLSKDSASSFSDFDLQEVIDSTVHRLHAIEQDRGKR
eukprot:TRINITY_DN572_c0_g1_i22.p1 TRINITY_DN572_c0_g1~~TRINITY_DN572_c0_g1_i22.p1  ORF type:complete len:330 (-),score=54.29 TRINITY_DN572_c0_g1_i22:635-1624(-)